MPKKIEIHGKYTESEIHQKIIALSKTRTNEKTRPTNT